MRFGSAGEPFRWYISQPPKNGPSTFQSLRAPSALSTNAPLRVPTRTRTPLMLWPPEVVPPGPQGAKSRSTAPSICACPRRYDDRTTGNSSFGVDRGEIRGDPGQVRPGLEWRQDLDARSEPRDLSRAALHALAADA